MTRATRPLRLLAVALVVLVGLMPASAIASLRPQVVGGVAASGSAARAVVVIETQSKQRCSGTLIGEQWVLTAGHCIEARANIFGSSTSINSLTSFGGAAGIRHPDYTETRNSVSNDVGLYRLDRSTTAGRGVPALATTADSWAWSAGTPITVFGWGRTVAGGEPTSTLQTATLTTLGDSDCFSRDEAEGNSYEASRSMCINAVGSSPCEGDSGGPMYASNGSTTVQVGVISYGIQGCTKHAVGAWLPGVLTWVRAVTKLPLGGKASTGTISNTVRSFGMDRYESAAATASFWNTASTVFVATGGNFPDSLAAGAAAARLDVPLLLVSSGGVPEATELQLRRLKPSTIYVAGGPAAVGEAVMSRLQEITGVAPARRFGQDRYETGESLTRLAWPSGTSDTAWIASGRNFVDPLIASSAAALFDQPFVLVDGRSALSSSQADLVRSLGVTRFNVVGTSDAVTATLIDDLRRLGTVTQFADTDPSRRSASVWSSIPGPAPVSLATSLNFPDALSAVPYVARDAGSPLLLVPGTCVPRDVKTQIVRLAPSRVTIFGGPAAVDINVESLAQCA